MDGAKPKLLVEIYLRK